MSRNVEKVEALFQSCPCRFLQLSHNKNGLVRFVWLFFLAVFRIICLDPFRREHTSDRRRWATASPRCCFPFAAAAIPDGRGMKDSG
jgi:hypothetical protein